MQRHEHNSLSFLQFIFPALAKVVKLKPQTPNSRPVAAFEAADVVNWFSGWRFVEFNNCAFMHLSRQAHKVQTYTHTHMYGNFNTHLNAYSDIFVVII